MCATGWKTSVWGVDTRRNRVFEAYKIRGVELEGLGRGRARGIRRARPTWATALAWLSSTNWLGSKGAYLLTSRRSSICTLRAAASAASVGTSGATGLGTVRRSTKCPRDGGKAGAAGKTDGSLKRRFCL